MKISPVFGGTLRGPTTVLPSIKLSRTHPMTRTPTGAVRKGSRNPQAYQSAFHDLPEKRKFELAQVVAGITQTQGKLAAQWWLEQQLDPYMSESSLPRPLNEALRESQAAVADCPLPCSNKAEAVTPNRERLIAEAPLTFVVMSPEERVFRSAIETAEPFTQEQLEHMAPALTPQSCKVFEFIHLYACSHALSREQSLKAQQISFFLPAETIPLATGVPKRTLYDALKRLKALGLVDYKGHVTTLTRYGNRCDGTVFAVKLNALRTGAAHVTYEDLKVTDYRDLEADITAQRTVYRLAQSETWADDLKVNLCRLLSWIQGKRTRAWKKDAEPRYLTVQASSKLGLEAVLNVTTGTAATRGQRIGAGASAIARAFGDQHSLAFWWTFCDRLASLAESETRDYSATVVACMQREVAARAEGFASNAAALFISRLQRSGIYGEIMAA